MEYFILNECKSDVSDCGKDFSELKVVFIWERETYTKYRLSESHSATGGQNSISKTIT